MLNFKSTVVILTALLATVSSAYAGPIQTIAFSGLLGYGWDGSAQFGAVGDLGGAAYSISLAFDTSLLKNDTCGAAANNSCNWTFGATGITETVTIKGVTKSYTSGGQIQFCACSNDAIYFNTSGSGPGFSGSFVDTNKLFSNHSNVNNPNLLLDFTNVALTSGDFGSYSLGPNGNTSFGLTPQSLSASRASATVPEPITSALFGVGLAGIYTLRRRKKAKTP